MALTDDEARALLVASQLRVTAPRVAVLRVLAEADAPLSRSEVLARLVPARWDPVTIYRNLMKLCGAGVATVVSRAEGIWRFELTEAQDAHGHAHFVCESCHRVTCLPADLTASIRVSGRWAEAVDTAVVQLRGRCPNCRQPAA